MIEDGGWRPSCRADAAVRDAHSACCASGQKNWQSATNSSPFIRGFSPPATPCSPRRSPGASRPRRVTAKPSNVDAPRIYRAAHARASRYPAPALACGIAAPSCAAAAESGPAGKHSAEGWGVLRDLLRKRVKGCCCCSPPALRKKGTRPLRQSRGGGGSISGSQPKPGGLKLSVDPWGGEANPPPHGQELEVLTIAVGGREDPPKFAEERLSPRGLPLRSW